MDSKHTKKREKLQHATLFFKGWRYFICCIRYVVNGIYKHKSLVDNLYNSAFDFEEFSHDD